MDNTYENISTCITIISDNLEDLQTNILTAIENNFTQRLELLGIERKCKDVVFSSGSGNSINVGYIIRNSAGEPIGTEPITIANIPYEFDTTNIYLSYDYNTETKSYGQAESINRYSVLLCFTTSETISGFAILSPSMLIHNTDGTYSIKNTGSDSVYTYDSLDDFMSYDTILEEGLNPDKIDFNNLYIRNKLINNPYCYYELDYTDLIDNDNVKSLPYVIDRFYDINEIKSSYQTGDPIYTYAICSVLETTRINYAITEYPVLFPKTIIAEDNTIKGYINYVYDIPTQKIDTGDSINNLYSGQLINLEDSQYILCNANTVVQIDNLIITSTNNTTEYTGRFHNYDIIYPKLDDVKVFSTLTSDPTTIVDVGENNDLSPYDEHIRTPVNESIHSWYQYNSNELEFSGVNAGNYDYLYKVCVPISDNTELTNSVRKAEYLRLHKVTTVDEGNILTQYPYIQYKTPDFDPNNPTYTPMSYMTSYTTSSSVVSTDLVGINNAINITLTLYQVKKDDVSGEAERPIQLANSVYQGEGKLTINAIVKKEENSNKYQIIDEDTEQIVFGEVVFSNTVNDFNYGAEIRLYNDIINADETYTDDKLKDDFIIYSIDSEYYTPSDLIYISYYYMPDRYLEYYGYTNTYIERMDLTGYYVNQDTVVRFNYDDDPDPDREGENREPRYALDYYFATGKILKTPLNPNGYDKIIINDIKLYMAFDNNGEPGEWKLIKPDNKDEFKYSIGPQHSWGYPLYVDNGLEDRTDLTTEQLYNEEASYFSSTTFTAVIWYKIECENFNTIMGSGTLTITDIPVKEVVTNISPTSVDYSIEDDVNTQSIPNVDKAFTLITGKLEDNTFYVQRGSSWVQIIPETDTYYDDTEVIPNKRYIWSGNQYIEVIMSDESESEQIINGYYYNDKFYSDNTHTEEITPETGITYVDFPTGNEYIWNGTAYIAKNN